MMTLVVVGFFLLCATAMWVGWRRKAAAQRARYAPFPLVPPADDGVDLGEPIASMDGIYVATTAAGRWQDRIVAHGVGWRGPATLRRHRAGVVVSRGGARDLFIAADAIRDVTTARGMAGKVMGTDGLLVITWQHGDTEVDTGFRGDDRGTYADWIAALRPARPAELATSAATDTAASAATPASPSDSSDDKGETQ
ncbi:transporter [Haloechinothrix salitolerans]|uniref:Transporter n=1 Tax=Haloechinothrix salitolerans TaxID=926830 RepID=A0ABW2C2X8_9PSEU